MDVLLLRSQFAEGPFADPFSNHAVAYALKSALGVIHFHSLPIWPLSIHPELNLPVNGSPVMAMSFGTISREIVAGKRHRAANLTARRKN
ncbi:hypothetical protein HNO89_000402 [Sporosarcina luteola]|nr:hypothetical protein [Sporosarcina luteola]